MNIYEVLHRLVERIFRNGVVLSPICMNINVVSPMNTPVQAVEEKPTHSVEPDGN